MTKTTLALYGGLVFAGGMGVGALAHRLYSTSSVAAAAPRGPEQWRQRFTQEMRTRVRLDADQAAKLEAFLDESRELFHQVREKYKPEMGAIYDAQVAKVKGMLRPDQLPVYEVILEEQRKGREKRPRQSEPAR
jgi:hypothetical protein